MCQCDQELVNMTQNSFKAYLENEHTLEEWGEWLEELVTTVLSQYRGQENFTHSARQFLLKWSFYR